MSLSNCKPALAADASHQHGCVTKCVGSDFKAHHGSYRKNGYDLISTTAKRQIYELDMTHATNKGRVNLVSYVMSGRTAHRTPLDPRAQPGAWFFGAGPGGENYKKGYLPFNHDYHHMLPWEVISDCFTLAEAKLIQYSTYNINDGLNMIILPKEPEYGYALGLPTHLGNHPTYNTDLMAIVNELKAAVNPAHSHRVLASNVAQIKQYFEQWETYEFTAMVAWARVSNVAAVQINAFPLNDMI